MTIDCPPQTPPAVVKYVEQNCKLTKKIRPAGTWHQYRVYYMDPDYPKDGKIRYDGPPVYLLYDGKNIRFSDYHETNAIVKSHNAKTLTKEKTKKH